jgi:carbon-monoxide dehydrogenase medium subunit
VPATEFFVNVFQTALQPEDVLVEVRVPKLGAASGWGYRYEKFQRVAQAWAIVAVAALVRRSGHAIGEARIALTNMGVTPLRATAAEAALAGTEAQPAVVERAAAHAADGTSPTSDISGQADYRQHLARVLTRSAVLAATGI